MSSQSQNLRVLFGAPGFFINDCHLEVDVDGENIFAGSFRGGFERDLPMEAGEHEMVTRIQIGGITRTKRYAITLGDARTHTATLVYSRLWGNFSRKLKLAEG